MDMSPVASHASVLRRVEPSETPGEDVDSDGSELSTASKISSVSMMSTQSERPRAPRKLGYPSHRLPSSLPLTDDSTFRRTQPRMLDHHHFHRDDEVQLNEEELRQIAMSTHDTIRHPPAAATAGKTDPAAASSAPSDKLINSAAISKTDPRNDGTLSDSVLTSQGGDSNKKRRPSMSSKALVILGLSKKTNSASNLGYGRYRRGLLSAAAMIDDVCAGKRFGFQRSEEIGVQPHLRSRALQKQTSKENETPSSAPPTDMTQSPLAMSHQRDQHHSMPHDMK